ncbi:rCG43330 [Rattus norvegicus]|uniref:RCG43330 n=1 Tax=Rattus norvegicus TaxID=10116 RepID=A6IWQ9_RAT|nr:rCG43330 [Rattus norvegicus]
MCSCRKGNLESSRRVGVNLHSTVSYNTTFFYKLSNGSRKTAALPLNIFF